MPPLGTPLAHSELSLNLAGVIGLFWGDVAISAMATNHFYPGRRWLGWYNTPGSYTIAKRFGMMANSRFWARLFPSSNYPRAILFGLDGRPGPRYTGAFSGVTMQTGHLGYLMMEKSKDTEPREIQGRVTIPAFVSYLAMKEVDYETPVELLPLEGTLFAIIPITCSFVACVLCALVHDWYGFSMVLLGIISNGLANYAVGEERLVFKSTSSPDKSSSPGHGILMDGNEVLVIKGREQDVDAVTKGHFDLGTDSKWCDHAIGCCSLLFTIQFLFQLLLIPQASLFGQTMFLSSLGVSWMYNSYLSSLEKEKIQEDLLFKKLGDPQMPRFRVGTRTTMAVFTCILLFHGTSMSKEEGRSLRTKALRLILPNDTFVWRRWLDKVVEQLLHLPHGGSEQFPYLEVEHDDMVLSISDRELLRTLLNDAKAAVEGYYHFCSSLPNHLNY